MIINFLIFLCLIFSKSFLEAKNEVQKQDLIILTVATNITDGYTRFIRSCHQNNLTVQTLGLGEPWLGGDLINSPGGGHKVNLLKKSLSKYKNQNNLIIMFVDSYDVIINGNKDEILKKFLDFDAKILFSAETFCWPDINLKDVYPEVFIGKRYLNSGGFIGYANYLFDMVNYSEIKDEDDDQLFYTKIFIDSSLRKHFNLKLDHKAELFQNLNGAINEIQLKFNEKSGEAFILNSLYNTKPIVIHGNGPSKINLNSLGNYLANTWSPLKGCIICNEIQTNFTDKKLDDYPLILIGIFINHPTPFLKEFFEDIYNLDYPKKKISIFISNSINTHRIEVEKFANLNEKEYSNIKILQENIEENKLRAYLLNKCLEIDCKFYLSIDSEARLTNKNSLINLMLQNRTIIAPLLNIPNKLWSNFWGSLSTEGFYARSHDYVDILNGKRRGIWNVPHISQAYLMKKEFIQKILDNLSNEINDFGNNIFTNNLYENDIDMSFSKNLRDNGYFIYVSNLIDYGHLVTSESYSTDHLHNDLYEIYTNSLDWERRYLHQDYKKALNEENLNLIQQPCPDVYWFPVVSELFCDHLVEEMENFGKWSEGKNNDSRLKGGYENVPTRDIHTNQIGFEQHWLYFLKQYIRPIQEKIFIGYYHDPPKAIMNFVVRYHPNEQPFLRPHHDSSTYTINMALNKVGKDYEGGGVRFLRYNCSLTQLKKGWSLIHPGRLTHYHEAFPVTKGTRYVMVSFVDP